MPVSRDPRRYRIEVRESPAQNKALPTPTFARAKRRRASDSADDQKSSTKNPKNQQRGCYHLEPNPLLMLRWNNDDPHYLQNPGLCCTVRLMEHIEDQDRYVLANQRIFGGTHTQSLQIFSPGAGPRSSSHPRNPSGDARLGYFVFNDLTVAAPGTYKLQFTLQEVQSYAESRQLTPLNDGESRPFEVVKSTAHVKRVPSSPEALALKEAGIKITIRKVPVKRKPKSERWDVQNEPHIHIQQALVENPGCFEIVQGNLGPPTRLLTTPLMFPGRQPFDPWTSVVQPDLNSTSSSMGYPNTMMTRTMPMTPFPGYGQYVGQKYPPNSDYTFQLNGSSGEQGYGLMDNGPYMTQATSAPTTQAYNALTSVPDTIAYPPTSSCMAPGSFFEMSNGVPSNGFMSNGGMSDEAASDRTTSNDTTSNETMDSGAMSQPTPLDRTMSNGYQQPHHLDNLSHGYQQPHQPGDMSQQMASRGTMSNGYQQHRQPGDMSHDMMSGGTMSNGYHQSPQLADMNTNRHFAEARLGY